MSLEKKVDAAVSSLLCTSRTGIQYADVNGFSAIRVGRNAVWKLTPQGGGQSFFVKRLNSEEQFRRELAGYVVASDLAASNPFFHAPDVLLIRPDLPAIVSFDHGGSSLADLTRNAFRLDRNPLRRQARMQLAVRCIRQAVEWLRKLHSTSIPTGVDLYNHSTDGVADRIRTKIVRLERSSASKNQSLYHALAIARAACQAASSKLHSSAYGLVFGDPNPTNIYLVDELCGFCDFEDIGVGDPDRDWAMLCNSLAAVQNRWMRWSCSEFTTTLRQFEIVPEKRFFFQLEGLLDRAWATHAHPRRMHRLLQEIEATASAFCDAQSRAFGTVPSITNRDLAHQ